MALFARIESIDERPSITRSTSAPGFFKISLEEWSSGIRDLYIALLVLGTTFAAIRIFTRAAVIRSFGYDDGFCILSWLAIVAQISFTIAVIPFGDGTAMISPSAAALVFKMAFVLKILGCLTYLTLKVTFFLTYLRIFSPQQTMRRLIWTGIAVCAAFYIAEFLSLIFRCHPVSASWEYSIHGKCANEPLPGAAIGIFNVISDLYILILPIPMVLGLHADIKRKIRLLTIFSAGILTVVTSIVKLVLNLQRDNNPNKASQTSVDVWSKLEYSIGLMVASAIALPAFWDRVLREPLGKYWTSTMSWSGRSWLSLKDFTSSMKTRTTASRKSSDAPSDWLELGLGSPSASKESKSNSSHIEIEAPS